MWHLQVRSPERILLDVAAVARLQAELVDGPITILRGHIPLVGELAAGVLRYHTADGAGGEIDLQPGILRIDRQKITVLTSGLSSPQIRTHGHPADGQPTGDNTSWTGNP